MKIQKEVMWKKLYSKKFIWLSVEYGGNRFIKKWLQLFHSARVYKEKHKILEKLRSQKDIIITHPGKGNGVVILNRSDYIKSMSKLISGKKNF